VSNATHPGVSISSDERHKTFTTGKYVPKLPARGRPAPEGELLPWRVRACPGGRPALEGARLPWRAACPEMTKWPGAPSFRGISKPPIWSG